MEHSVRPVDDLPAEARELVEKAVAQIDKLQQKADKDAAAVRERADQEVEELMDKARKKVEGHLEKLVAELKPLQVAHAREGQLDEALAIREQIKQLRTQAGGTEPDPGNLVGYQGQVGKTFLFDVLGREDGAIWGTDVYTSDSTLAAAAVHAGVIQPGERKAVRVTIVAPPAGFRGSTRNGVTSAAFGAYPGAYRLG